MKYVAFFLSLMDLEGQKSRELKVKKMLFFVFLLRGDSSFSAKSNEEAKEKTYLGLPIYQMKKSSFRNRRGKEWSRKLIFNSQ